MLEVLRHLHHVLGVVDERLGQVAVAEVDPPLVIDLLAGDVVAADLVEERLAGPADGAGDVVAGLDLGHLVAHLDDLPEALVADDQVVAAGRGVAVEGLVDLAVGGVDADLEHLDQHGPPFGDAADVRMRLVGQLRGGDLAQVDAVRFARQDGNGFHRNSTRQRRTIDRNGWLPTTSCGAGRAIESRHPRWRSHDGPCFNTLQDNARSAHPRDGILRGMPARFQGRPGLPRRGGQERADFIRRTTFCKTLTRAHSLLSASTSTQGAISVPVFSIISQAAAS